jgi:cell division protease FtsH
MRAFLFFIQAFFVNCFIRNSFNRYAFSCKSESELNPLDRNYSPFGRKYYEEYLKKLNSRNSTMQTSSILGLHEISNSNYVYLSTDENITFPAILFNETADANYSPEFPNIRIIFKKQKSPASMLEYLQNLKDEIYKANNQNENNLENGEHNISDNEDDHYYDLNGRLIRTRRNGSKPGQKSENFEVVTKSPLTFADIGGYDTIKKELSQCVDILSHYKKYSKYNVRIPKGLLLEGPPGNGKTMLAKGFAGETNASFIAISGSQFQDKYVGVGSTRVRELFQLANNNRPCIIFIDEIDAIGRKRSNDGETSGTERDSTLNELLINLDGFKTGSGIFLMGATNRADLLDPALLRPGRIDKRIFIGVPDAATREAIINIHLKGKPYDSLNINVNDLKDMTAGLSGAQIENLLNEGMLNALREDRTVMTYEDLDLVMNKIMVGWQPTEHQFTADIIDRIAIHEMGHAIMGILSQHHSKVSKVIINLSAPNTPGYTMFESSTSNIYKREALFEHLMILLGGRIAEEIIYDVSVTTGALNDFDETLKLAEKMVLYYGLGNNIIYPRNSEKYKEIIDDQVIVLIQDAYRMAFMILKECKPLIIECANILKREKILKIDKLMQLIQTKYPEVLNLKISNDK